ncbi:pentapeptide repeat-containing protein [Streptomyces sp. WSLK1-3]|uniref:pentapeptide repeat-containing protein n=1 Tax=Streptomyces sp. WSLK1-3 TaxID=3375475 RepID=UPI0037A99983
MSDEQPQTKVPIKALALGILAATVFVIAFWRAPWWFDSLHIRKTNLEPADGVIITGVRTGLVAFAAGIIAGIGLYYTHKKHVLDQRQFEHAREQFEESQKQFATTLGETQKRDERQAELTREGQVTGRYVDAIKLLASEQLAERLGGIYALERIMKDSDRDHRTIVEVLSAFIRTSLQEAEGQRKEGKQQDPEEQRGATPRLTRKRAPIVLSEDVKAALAVLSRRGSAQQQAVQVELSDAQLAHHNLGGVNWQGMNLERANLVGANLKGANLDGVKLDGAELDGATLTKASLRGASLRDASLASADLLYADLTGARLDDARLTQAVMNKVTLVRARLVRAHLQHASLNEATLDGANLTSARLNGARLREASLRQTRLRRADLLEANLQNADFEGANLELASLAEAHLERAKLDKAHGLGAHTLAHARIYHSTALPPGLAETSDVAARIQECEDRDADELEAAMKMAEEREEEYLLGEGINPEVK